MAFHVVNPRSDGGRGDTRDALPLGQESSCYPDQLQLNDEKVVVVGIVGDCPDGSRLPILSHLTKCWDVSMFVDDPSFDGDNDGDDGGGKRSLGITNEGRLVLYHCVSSNTMYLHLSSFQNASSLRSIMDRTPTNDTSQPDFLRWMERREFHRLRALTFMFHLCHQMLIIHSGVTFDVSWMRTFQWVKRAKAEMAPSISRFLHAARTKPIFAPTSQFINQQHTASMRNRSKGSSASARKRALQDAAAAVWNSISSPGRCVPQLHFLFVIRSKMLPPSSHVSRHTSTASTRSRGKRGGKRTEGNVLAGIQESLEHQIRQLLTGARLTGSGKGGVPPLFYLGDTHTRFVHPVRMGRESNAMLRLFDDFEHLSGPHMKVDDQRQCKEDTTQHRCKGEGDMLQRDMDRAVRHMHQHSSYLRQNSSSRRVKKNSTLPTSKTVFIGCMHLKEIFLHHDGLVSEYWGKDRNGRSAPNPMNGLFSTMGASYKFSKSRCTEAYPSAREVYIRDLPPLYSRATHEAHLKKSINYLNERARGPAVPHYRNRLSEEMARYWKDGRQLCDSVSLGGRACVHRLHTVSSSTHEPKKKDVVVYGRHSSSASPSMKEKGQQYHSSKPRGITKKKESRSRLPPVLSHSSGVRMLHACHCGQSRAIREDPFDLEEANELFFERAGAQCCAIGTCILSSALDGSHPSVLDPLSSMDMKKHESRMCGNEDSGGGVMPNEAMAHVSEKTVHSMHDKAICRVVRMRVSSTDAVQSYWNMCTLGSRHRVRKEELNLEGMLAEHRRLYSVQLKLPSDHPVCIAESERKNKERIRRERERREIMASENANKKHKIIDERSVNGKDESVSATSKEKKGNDAVGNTALEEREKVSSTSHGPLDDDVPSSSVLAFRKGGLVLDLSELLKHSHEGKRSDRASKRLHHGTKTSGRHEKGNVGRAKDGKGSVNDASKGRDKTSGGEEDVRTTSGVPKILQRPSSTPSSRMEKETKNAPSIDGKESGFNKANGKKKNRKGNGAYGGKKEKGGKKNMRNVRKEEEWVSGSCVKVLFGFEYECCNGHRFLWNAPSSSSSPSHGSSSTPEHSSHQSVRSAYKSPTQSQMMQTLLKSASSLDASRPLFRLCISPKCKASGVYAQLQRLYFCTPDKRVSLSSHPTIEWTYNTSKTVRKSSSYHNHRNDGGAGGVGGGGDKRRRWTFKSPAPFPLPPDSLVCVRLPYVYSVGGRSFMGPRESSAEYQSRILGGSFLMLDDGTGDKDAEEHIVGDEEGGGGIGSMKGV